MADLLIPIARRGPMGYGSTSLLPKKYAGKVVALTAKSQTADLAEVFGGRAATPAQNIVIVGPDGRTPILIAGLGVTEVAELEELAQEAFEKAETKLKKTGTVIPFAEHRERLGKPEAKEFDGLLRQALLDRIKKHKQNPISDPARQPNRGG